jgi:hypothetical protein
VAGGGEGEDNLIIWKGNGGISRIYLVQIFIGQPNKCSLNFSQIENNVLELKVQKFKMTFSLTFETQFQAIVT